MIPVMYTLLGLVRSITQTVSV